MVAAHAEHPRDEDLARTLHIEREMLDGEARPITLPEWKEAVERVEGVRMAEGDASAVNPLTQAAVVIPNRGGDVEIFRADCQRWLRALWWTPGGIVRFAAPETDGDRVAEIARTLASELQARIVDNEGRLYD